MNTKKQKLLSHTQFSIQISSQKKQINNHQQIFSYLTQPNKKQPINKPSQQYFQSKLKSEYLLSIHQNQSKLQPMESQLQLCSQDIIQVLNKDNPNSYSQKSFHLQLSFQRLRLINDLLKKNNYLTIEQIQQEMAQKIYQPQEKKELQRAHIEQLMVELQYVYRPIKKVYFRRNLPQIKKERAAFCTALLHHTQQNTPVYFFHQYAIHTMIRRNYAWFKIDVQKQCSWIKDNGVPLLIIANSCGSIVWTTAQKGYQIQSYQQNVRKIMCRIVAGGNYIKEKVLVFDPDAMEYQSIIQNVAKQYKFFIEKIPMYSKQLNPLYRWSNDLREKIKKEKFNNHEELILKVQKILKDSKKDNLKEHIKFTYLFAVMGQKEEDF